MLDNANKSTKAIWPLPQWLSLSTYSVRSHQPVGHRIATTTPSTQKKDTTAYRPSMTNELGHATLEFTSNALRAKSTSKRKSDQARPMLSAEKNEAISVPLTPRQRRTVNTTAKRKTDIVATVMNAVH